MHNAWISDLQFIGREINKYTIYSSISIGMCSTISIVTNLHSIHIVRIIILSVTFLKLEHEYMNLIINLEICHKYRIIQYNRLFLHVIYQNHFIHCLSTKLYASLVNIYESLQKSYDGTFWRKHLKLVMSLSFGNVYLFILTHIFTFLHK